MNYGKESYRKELRFVFVSGLLLSLLAILILTFIDNAVETPALLHYAMTYFGTFVALAVTYFMEGKGWTIKRPISDTEWTFGKLFLRLWLALPTTIIYSLILRDYFFDWKYQMVVMYLIWFVLALFFMIRTLQDVKKQNSIQTQ